MNLKKILSPDGYMTMPKERFSYWSYFVGQNFFYNIVTAYLVTYLMLLGIDLAKIAVVMLIVKIWDAVNDPLFGVIFDKVKFKSKLKCLPWLRISVGLVPISTIILFIIPGGASENIKLVWFAAGYMLWDTCYTICDVPIYSMVTTMTDNINERNTLMSIGRVFSGAGMGISSVLCTFLISEQVGLGFGSISIILAVGGFLFMLPLCITGKERNYHAELEEPTFSLKSMVKYIGHNKYLLIYFLGFFFTNGLMTSSAISTFVSYYLFGNTNFNIILGILGSVPSFLAAVLIPFLAKRFDKLKILFWSTTASAILGFAIYFTGWKNMTAFIILTVFRSIFSSLVGTINFMFTPDCAEYGQYKTGIDAKGITFAIQTFSTKIAAAVASSFGLFVMKKFDWIEINATSFEEIKALNITQSATALNGLWVTYILIPSIGMVISLLVYLFYKLRDRDIQVMAKCNAGEITREEAQQQLSREY
jgi:GPH family glycoside/pentoside/hexuronide:cation symporter